MRSGDYSQLPVYDPAGRCVGLLTAETIARWVAAKLAGGVGLVEEATVLEVLGHTEDPANHCVFLPRTATAFDPSTPSRSMRPRGGRWTRSWSRTGARNELPLSLMTTYDIPTLLAAITRTSPV